MRNIVRIRQLFCDGVSGFFFQACTSANLFSHSLLLLSFNSLHFEMNERNEDGNSASTNADTVFNTVSEERNLCIKVRRYSYIIWLMINRWRFD